MPNVSLVDGHVDEVKDYPPYLDAPKKPVYRTNYDRIRNMSIEEMAEFLESTNNLMAIKLGGEYIVRDKKYIKIYLESEVDTNEI